MHVTKIYTKLPTAFHYIDYFNFRTGAFSLPILQNCPHNKSEWENRAATKPCQGDDVYHCLLSSDKATVKEYCIEKSLVLEGGAFYSFKRVEKNILQSTFIRNLYFSYTKLT